MSLGCRCADNKINDITHSTQLAFLDFVDLFKSFSLRCRKDLKELFEHFATMRVADTLQTPMLWAPRNKDMGELWIDLQSRVLVAS